MTSQQRELIERAASVAAADLRIVAAFLGGSFADGTADDYADIDLHIVVEDVAYDDFREGWVDFANAIAPMVHTKSLGVVVGGYAITADWLHLDVVVHERSGFEIEYGCRPLFDRAGLLPKESTPRPSQFGTPYFPADAVNFYFYLLGNLCVVLGRGELTLATNGAIMRRDIGLVPLMLAENGVRKTDGNKRQNPYLTAEQRAVLDELPPLEADPLSIIAFDRTVALQVIARGRALARATGAAWPTDFERATCAYVNRELDMGLPVEP
jgi:predicted nucleotidyltransferase